MNKLKNNIMSFKLLTFGIVQIKTQSLKLIIKVILRTGLMSDNIGKIICYNAVKM